MIRRIGEEIGYLVVGTIYAGLGLASMTVHYSLKALKKVRKKMCVK
jgi:hypothetical protein